MNYGYMMGASSVLTSMFRQDVASNNLANMETVGFKPDSAFTIPRQAVRQEDHLESLPSNALLERLGAGVLLAPTQTSFTQGSIMRTGNKLDLAIQGDGFFQVGIGTQGGNYVRLTRDGRFTMNSQGQLVTASEGHPVLDTNDRPITLDRTQNVDVDATGVIRQNGQQVAQIKFVDVPNKAALKKMGDTLYAPTAAAVQSRLAATGSIVQGAVEQSSVDPIAAMMAVQDAASDVSTALKIMQIHDDLMSRAISSLGKVG